MEGLEDVLKQLNAMDVEGISDRAKNTLDQMNQAVDEAKIKDISVSIRSSLSKLDRVMDSKKWFDVLNTLESAIASIDRFGTNADETVDQIRLMVARLDKIVIENETGVSNAIKDFQDAMGNADRLMANSSELINKTSSSMSTLVDHLLVTEQNLQSASDNLRRFIEILANQPSQLIFSEPPEPRRIEK
jgi:ABC-type transporter Mla subunit MlaD